MIQTAAEARKQAKENKEALNDEKLKNTFAGINFERAINKAIKEGLTSVTMQVVMEVGSANGYKPVLCRADPKGNPSVRKDSYEASDISWLKQYFNNKGYQLRIESEFRKGPEHAIGVAPTKYTLGTIVISWGEA